MVQMPWSTWICDVSHPTHPTHPTITRWRFRKVGQLSSGDNRYVRVNVFIVSRRVFLRLNFRLSHWHSNRSQTSSTAFYSSTSPWHLSAPVTSHCTSFDSDQPPRATPASSPSILHIRLFRSSKKPLLARPTLPSYFKTLHRNMVFPIPNRITGSGILMDRVRKERDNMFTKDHEA